MSLAEVLQELPAFTVAERHLLIRRAIELDDSKLSAEDEELIASRLEDHRNDPSTAVTLETIKESIRSRFSN